jgi:Zn-dependent protease with chaperone function
MQEFPMRDLVHPKESVYFAIAAVVSVLIYLGLIISGIGLIYIIVGALGGLMVHGLFTGTFRGNAVRVSERQFADIHGLVQRLSREMALGQSPDVYILQSGGVLNAFATRFLGRNFVVLFSDVVELARKQGEGALAFVIAHELAHHRRGHTGWKRLLVLPAMWIPFLGSAYSRACEYTCDAHGARLCPEGAVDGLLVLAAGKQLYRSVDAAAFARQAEMERGFWLWLAEALASHPNLPKRVAAVRQRLQSAVPVAAVYPSNAEQPTGA